MDELKRLAFHFWKTHRFASKIDLIKYMESKYINPASDIVEAVEDVLSNIDKYEEKFKQTKAEQFFIELLLLLNKYHVAMFAERLEDDPEDIRIFFETTDGVFGQDYCDSIDPEAVNGFEECVEDGEIPRRYEFPAVSYFEQENINVKK